MANLNDLPEAYREAPPKFDNPHLAGIAVSLYETGQMGALAKFLANSTKTEIPQFNGNLNAYLRQMLPETESNPLLLAEAASNAMLEAIAKGDYAVSNAIDKLAKAMEADPEQRNVFTSIFIQKIGHALAKAQENEFSRHTLLAVKNAVDGRDYLQAAWEKACAGIGFDPVDPSKRETPAIILAP